MIESSLKVVNYLRGKKAVDRVYAKTLSVLASGLEIQRKLTKPQSDLIKNLIEVCKQHLSELKTSQGLFELSHIYKRLIALYFKYKEQELRNGIAKYYEQHRLDPVRSLDIKDLGKNEFQKI